MAINPDNIHEYNLSKLTGCVQGNVPGLSYEEALNDAIPIKVVDISQQYPIYGEVIAINYALSRFTLLTEGEAELDLPISDYLVFHADPIDNSIPMAKESAIIIASEIFTVVDDTQIPIWVGDQNLVYYPDDIQALTQKYGYKALIS